MQEYISKNQVDTEKIASDFAKTLKGGELLAFSGNLGVGKTIFVKSLAKTLGIDEHITSPTFVLMKVYDLDYKQIDQFVHIDCYRLSEKEDLFDIGLSDYLNQDNIIVAIEWADKINDLPDTAIKIHIELLAGDERKIIIN